MAKKYKKWTQEDKNVLYDYYIKQQYSAAKCAEMMNRSLKSVLNMASIFGFVKRKCNSQAEIAKIHNLGVEQLSNLSEQEKTNLCLNCPLEECINCLECFPN